MVFQGRCSKSCCEPRRFPRAIRQPREPEGFVPFVWPRGFPAVVRDQRRSVLRTAHLHSVSLESGQQRVGHYHRCRDVFIIRRRPVRCGPPRKTSTPHLLCFQHGCHRGKSRTVSYVRNFILANSIRLFEMKTVHQYSHKNQLFGRFSYFIYTFSLYIHYSLRWADFNPMYS